MERRHCRLCRGMALETLEDRQRLEQVQMGPNRYPRFMIRTQFQTELDLDVRMWDELMEEAESGSRDDMVKALCFLHAERKQDGEPPDQVVFSQESCVYINGQPAGTTTHTVLPSSGPSAQLDITRSHTIFAPSYCRDHDSYGRKPYFVLEAEDSYVICDGGAENCIYLYKNQIELARRFFHAVSDSLSQLSID
jgi:hypothetical protein